MGGSTSFLRRRALDNGVYLASASQLGDYLEVCCGTPGGIYFSDGHCISEVDGALSVGEVDLSAPEGWRRLYGNIMLLAGAPVAPLKACS